MKLFLNVLILTTFLLSGMAHAQDSQEGSASPKLNINEAPATALAERLDGVGEVKAEAIVSFRNENGPFASVGELSNVSGIGPATIRNNRDAMTAR